MGEMQDTHSKYDSIVAQSAETEHVGAEDIEGSDSDPGHADWDPCSQGCGAEPMDQGLSGCLNARTSLGWPRPLGAARQRRNSCRPH